MESVSCFVINLSKDHLKKSQMIKITNENDINPIFIDAIYGADLKSDEISDSYSEKLTKKNIGRALTKGEIGCALSHLSIYKRMIEEQLEIALILEDDISFNFNYVKLTSLIKKMPPDWECILLGHHSGLSRDEEGSASFWGRKSANKFLDIVRFSERVAGGYGYLINQKGAKKRLKEYQVIGKPTDYWEDKSINLYGISPPIINIANEYKVGSLLDRERSNENSESYTQKLKSKLKKTLSNIGFISLVNFFNSIKKFLLKIKPLKPYY